MHSPKIFRALWTTARLSTRERETDRQTDRQRHTHIQRERERERCALFEHKEAVSIVQKRHAVLIDLAMPRAQATADCSRCPVSVTVYERRTCVCV